MFVGCNFQVLHRENLARLPITGVVHACMASPTTLIESIGEASKLCSHEFCFNCAVEPSYTCLVGLFWRWMQVL